MLLRLITLANYRQRESYTVSALLLPMMSVISLSIGFIDYIYGIYTILRSTHFLIDFWVASAVLFVLGGDVN